MKKGKRPRTVGFWIFFVLITLLSLVLFELGKNTLWGWALLLILLIGWVLLRIRILPEARFLPRLGVFLAGICLIGVLFKLSGPPERCVPAVTGKNLVITGVVTVEEGQLTGVCTEDGEVEVYAGIPYAKPPVGALRWKEPQPPEHWTGVRACNTFAPMSMQPRNHPVINSLMQIFGYHTYEFSLRDNWIEAMSEDSL